MFSPLKNQKGFTLIELVIIIILIGVLAAVAVPRYVDLRENAVMASAQATLDGGRAGIMLDFSDKVLNTGVYADILPSTAAGTAILSGSSDLATLEGFMQSTPSYPPNGSYNIPAAAGFRWWVLTAANPGGKLGPPVMDGIIDVSCLAADAAPAGGIDDDCFVSKL